MGASSLKAPLHAGNHKTPCAAGHGPKARLFPYMKSSTTRLYFYQAFSIALVSLDEENELTFVV